MSDLNNSEKAKAFVTWETEEEKAQAFAEIAQNHEHYDGVQKASAYSRRSFIDIEPNRSVRTGLLVRITIGSDKPKLYLRGKKKPLECVWLLMTKWESFVM